MSVPHYHLPNTVAITRASVFRTPSIGGDILEHFEEQYSSKIIFLVSACKRFAMPAQEQIGQCSSLCLLRTVFSTKENDLDIQIIP